ncbi:hypothetical protein HZS_3806, partial [Henneguya salminicola]
EEENEFLTIPGVHDTADTIKDLIIYKRTGNLFLCSSAGIQCLLIFFLSFTVFIMCFSIPYKWTSGMIIFLSFLYTAFSFVTFFGCFLGIYHRIPTFLRNSMFLLVFNSILLSLNGIVVMETYCL